MATDRYELRSAQFRREREGSWRDLEELLARVERAGPKVLNHDELIQLPMLYRTAVGSLSVARAISLDRNVLDYLTSLAQRAHLAVYSGRRRPLQGVAQFFSWRFPGLVSTFRVPFLIALLTLVLGVLTGYELTRQEPDRYYSFVGGMSEGRTPAASTASLREVLYAGRQDRNALDVFASFLFDHNARIGILCLALGFAAGVPVVWLLFSNGLTLGAMAALYASRGLGSEFWAWVLPHGVTELLAVVLCGTAGLAFGSALVFPGPLSRLEQLHARGREAGLLVVGAVAMFFMAALLESFFRTLVHDPVIRWSVAGLTAAWWIVYFGGGARERHARHH